MTEEAKKEIEQKELRECVRKFLKTVPDGYYAIVGGVLYDMQLAHPHGAKSIKVMPFKFEGEYPKEAKNFDEVSEDIQHVGYDEEQCGRTK